MLDCDTGTDDAVAIMLAGLSAELELAAVTTVRGNVPVDVVTENTRRVLQLIGRSDVPVYEGAARPLERDDFPVPKAQLTGFEMHGTYLDLPPASGPPEDASATDFLITEARRHLADGSRFTLVATGPLTNVARAVRSFPPMTHAIDTIVVMGGGHAVSNVTAAAEFNLWADPEAAAEVLSAGFSDLLLVPLDATHRALLSRDDCSRLRAAGTPAGIASAQLVEQRIVGHDDSQPMAERGTAPVHDAVCVAALLDRRLLTTVEAHVDVETQGRLTVGRSVIDLHHRTGRKPNARVAVDASPVRLMAQLLNAFSSREPAPDGPVSR
ncbi:nucleoside hydrolase [Microbacterium lacus]|uniref:nucleoside hydrolase n=1 Tax=Microbacterium lacus TaxID=415217 RepID=UPI0031D78692